MSQLDKFKCINISMENLACKKSATFYYYRNRRRGLSAKIILIVLLIFVLVSTIVIFAIAKNRKHNNFCTSAYLLVLGKFSKASDASDFAERVENAGGAGYIYVDSNYEVIAFLYPTQAKAEKVKENLHNWDSTIKKVTFSKLNKKKYDYNQIKTINFLQSLIYDFYQTVIDFDNRKIEGPTVDKKLKKTMLDISLLKNKLSTTDVDIIILQALEQIENEIDAFFKNHNSEAQFSSKVKYLCVLSFDVYSTLCAELAKM